MTTETPCWKNTFNSHHKLYGWIDKAFDAARTVQYPFIAWNGWVYKSSSHGGEADRLMLVQDLK